MKMRYNLKIVAYLLLMFFTLSFNWGCKKLVEVDAPPTSLSSGNVFASDPTAISAVTAIYSTFSRATPYHPELLGISGTVGLSSDDVSLYSGVSNPTIIQYGRNALTNSTLDLWTSLYRLIFNINAASEGINSSGTLSPTVKQQLIGEVKFSRAFCYFYLVNLYGDVPLVLTTDYSVNATLPRTPKSEVWKQIIKDLRESQTQLSSSFLDGTLSAVSPERLRPTKWAATSLLARAYLYTGNWAGADSAATSVINNSNLFSLDAVDEVFLKNSTESILQFQPVVQSVNTFDAYYFILRSSGPDGNNRPAYLSNSLLNTFETGDLRKTHWINNVTANGTTYNYPYKYKNNIINSDITEYTTVLRLAEQYLIRAEAEANGAGLGIAGAISDLNSIRSRAGLPNTAANDKSSLLDAILKERRLELFSEWGHRWLDLKRIGTIDAVMGTGGACAAKGGVWSTNAQWYPIPLSELQADVNLVQNSGY